MMTEMRPPTNTFGQPIGQPLSGIAPLPPSAEDLTIDGTFCSLRPLVADDHGSDLWATFAAEPDERAWTYLPYGPFPGDEAFLEWLWRCEASAPDTQFVAILNPSNQAVGIAAYLRIQPSHASIEVGHVHFGPGLVRTAAATESMYLMMRQVFRLGYRRYEWKCDVLNEPSRAAARRLGFTYEGTFRQATHYKSRNRDTAWFSIIDSEWPEVDAAFGRWLAPSNFDAGDRQRAPLKARRS